MTTHHVVRVVGGFLIGFSIGLTPRDIAMGLTGTALLGLAEFLASRKKSQEVDWRSAAFRNGQTKL